MVKFDEGVICGNVICSMFDIVFGLFKRSEEFLNVCKKGLVCRIVGYDLD